MGLHFLGFLLDLSSVMAILPIMVMMWHLKALKQRSFGWFMFGYFTTQFLAGALSYLSYFLYDSPLPVFHIFMMIQAFFTFLLFRSEYINSQFKKATDFFLGVTILTEIIEFNVRGGLFTNNIITYAVINLCFILQYFLFMVDAIKNRPKVVYDRKGPFLVLSATLFYSISQLLFCLLEEDLRLLLVKNHYAVLLWALFIWFYTIYLLFASYFLWRNLRS